MKSSDGVTSKVENTPDLSVIIVSWNTKELLSECLMSLYRSTKQAILEVIVVDNASNDGSPEMVSHKFKHVILIQTNSNLGFATASNIGINRAHGRHICLVNSDVRVLDGCLDELSLYLDNNATVGIAGPQILNRDMTVQASCYGFPTPWNTLTHALGMDKLLSRMGFATGLYRKYWPYSTTRIVEVLSGCFWIVRRQALAEVGLMDEGFFFAWEDFDWCKRFKTAGWNAVYVVHARAIHHHYGSSVSDPVRFAIEAQRSQLWYWRKHYGTAGVLFGGTMVLLRHCLQAAHAVVLYFLKRSDRKQTALKVVENLSVIRKFWALPHSNGRTCLSLQSHAHSLDGSTQRGNMVQDS